MSRSIGVLLLYCIGIIAFSDAAVARKTSSVDQFTEDNWNLMLTGEWMVEFYAPWCPACKEMEPTWAYLGDMKKSLGINVGKVDVTDSPGLSGRFMVTALPTIYHVKDGEFRQYKSPRDRESLIDFIRSKTWMKVEPVSSWKSPTSIQMTLMSKFFKLSQVLRAIHNQLMDDYGLPTWGSYFIFAVATIIMGALLGLVIVCIIDFFAPPKHAKPVIHKKRKDSSESSQDKASDEDELIEKMRDDDLVDEDASDSEKQSSKKSSAANSPNARKRKTRKAD